MYQHLTNLTEEEQENHRFDIIMVKLMRGMIPKNLNYYY